jgi:hypothetical protein
MDIPRENGKGNATEDCLAAETRARKESEKSFLVKGVEFLCSFPKLSACSKIIHFGQELRSFDPLDPQFGDLEGFTMFVSQTSLCAHEEMFATHRRSGST